MGWLGGLGAVLGGFKGAQAAGDYSAQKATADQAKANMYAGSSALNTSEIQKRYDLLMEMYGPALAQMQAQASLAGQYASRSAIGGLNRAGLGSTGLGMGIAGGIQAGAMQGANALRLSMMQDVANQAINLQSQRAGLLAGAPVVQQPNLMSNVGQRAGEALGAIGLWQQYGGAGSTPSLYGNSAGVPNYPAKVPGPIKNPTQAPMFFNW